MDWLRLRCSPARVRMLDFCGGGGVTVAEVSTRKAVDYCTQAGTPTQCLLSVRIWVTERVESTCRQQLQTSLKGLRPGLTGASWSCRACCRRGFCWPWLLRLWKSTSVLPRGTTPLPRHVLEGLSVPVPTSPQSQGRAHDPGEAMGSPSAWISNREHPRTENGQLEAPGLPVSTSRLHAQSTHHSGPSTFLLVLQLPIDFFFFLKMAKVHVSGWQLQNPP